jgi:hypothetical protein
MANAAPNSIKFPGWSLSLLKGCHAKRADEYTNLEDERIYKRVSSWETWVLMHENDHINGVLFIDRLDGKTRADMEVRLSQLKERLAQSLNNLKVIV